MLRDILVIGDKIDMKKLENVGGIVRSTGTYVSQLLDIVNENTISIAMPYSGGKLVILELESRYRLCFYTSKGLYQCNGIMMKGYRENNAIIAAFRLTSDLEKFQRRQYFRLECIHEVEYRVILQEETEMEDRIMMNKFINSEERAEARRRLSLMNTQWLKGSITDLSGGGAKFNSDYKHNIGDKVRIKIDFIIGGELKKKLLAVEIIAADKLLSNPDKYEHRAEFYDIGKTDREDLIKYIFEQERKRRRNDKV